MLDEMRRRWSVIPTWIKVVPVAGLLVGLSLANWWLLPLRPDLAAFVQRLFFLPLFMASLLFGLKGGLICAALIGLNYLDFFHDPANGRAATYLMALELLLYFFTGALTGFLVDRERREAKRLKEAENLALLGQAAGAVAHELKTPLIAIGGFAQRIQRDLPPDHPYRHQLKIIVDQVSHMETLLRQMLDYTRPLELRPVPVDPAELVQEVFILTEAMAKKRAVRLAHELGGKELRVPADRIRLKQVLINLVQNAVQASPRGGVVVVRALEDKEHITLEIMDQGPGIAPEDQKNIFLPFFTTKKGGTGLGLAITRKNVLAHQGALELQSTFGKGSTFRVVLPRAGQSDAPASA
jgi:two-component system sensor histidine kinase HydH